MEVCYPETAVMNRWHLALQGRQAIGRYLVRMRVFRIFVAAVCTVALTGSASALRLPSAPRCPVFPASNPWNQRVDRLPVASNSATMVRSIGVGSGVHADFGSGLYDGGKIGIPFD